MLGFKSTTLINEMSNFSCYGIQFQIACFHLQLKHSTNSLWKSSRNSFCDVKYIMKICCDVKIGLFRFLWTAGRTSTPSWGTRRVSWWPRWTRHSIAAIADAQNTSRSQLPIQKSTLLGIFLHIKPFFLTSQCSS